MMFVTRPVTVISSSRVGSSGVSDVRVMATEATGSVAAAGDGISQAQLGPTVSPVVSRPPKPRLLAVRGPYAPRTTSSPRHLNSPHGRERRYRAPRDEQTRFRLGAPTR